MTNPSLAYIFQGQLHLEGDGSNEILESPFGRSLRDRAIQIYQRNAWKLRGRGGQSLSHALRMPAERDAGEFRIDITSVTRGLQRGSMLYTLETDEISGVFARDASGSETRLFHTADFHTRYLDVHPNGSEVALSTRYRNGMANLAVLDANGSGFTEVTDGESIDEAPRWVPGPGRRLVFQSAGLARDAGSRFSGFGPFAIQQLDLETGALSCLAQDNNFDFLWPRIGAGGTLYYIRRPNGNAEQPVAPWVALQQTVILPLRILWAIGKLIELYVARRTGSPILPVKDTPEEPAKTPASWLLMRQTPGAEPETIAEHALSFDLADDGSVIYSSGSEVYRIPPNGAPAAKIMSGVGIDLIAAL
jgi:hypothetical protein